MKKIWKILRKNCQNSLEKCEKHRNQLFFSPNGTKLAKFHGKLAVIGGLMTLPLPK